MPGRRYYDPDTDEELTKSVLRRAEPSIQTRVMRAWFDQHFEDPVNRLPYESSEGGYQWIYGGPCDAHEELLGEFEGLVPEDVISTLADELTDQCSEWSPADHDDDLTSAVLSNTEFGSTLNNALDNIKDLLEVPLENRLEQHYLRMVHVSAITALETFLSDAFINTVLADGTLLRQFIETNPEFTKRNLSLDQIFKRMGSLRSEVEKYLFSFSWHNLAKIGKMYRTCLGVEFPDGLDSIQRAITKRHDLVHRSGKTKEGEEVSVSREDIQALVDAIRELGQHIDSQLTDRGPE